MHSGDTCIDAICRLSVDTKTEPGDSVLYTTAVTIDIGIYLCTSMIAEPVGSLQFTLRGQWVLHCNFKVQYVQRNCN